MVGRRPSVSGERELGARARSLSYPDAGPTARAPIRPCGRGPAEWPGSVGLPAQRSWGSPNLTRASAGCGRDKGAGRPRRPGDAVENSAPGPHLREGRRDPAPGDPDLEGVSSHLFCWFAPTCGPRGGSRQSSAAPTSRELWRPGLAGHHLAVQSQSPSKPPLPGAGKKKKPPFPSQPARETQLSRSVASQHWTGLSINRGIS